MAQPLPYERDYDFENFQSGHPSTPLPGDKVNSELDQVAATLDEVLARVALLQDDDLALKRGSVGPDQLADSVTLGFEPPSVWLTATAYIVNDTVFQTAGFYKCLVSHTSGTFSTDLAAAKWELIADFTVATADAQAAQAAAEAAQAAAESARDSATASASSASTQASAAASSANSAAADAAQTAADVVSAAASASAAQTAATTANGYLSTALAAAELAAADAEAMYDAFVAAAISGRTMLLAPTTCDGSTNTFDLVSTVQSVIDVDVYVAGVRQPATSDYYSIISAGAQVQLVNTPSAGTVVWAQMGTLSVSLGAGVTGIDVLRADTSASARMAMGLGTASQAAIGTSGDTVPKNNTTNVFSAMQSFDAGITQTKTTAAGLSFNHPPFSGQFEYARAHNLLSYNISSTNTAPQHGLAVTVQAPGAATNGPGYTTQAMWLGFEQTDWRTTDVAGELDLAYGVGVKGAKGDAFGWNIDLYKIDERFTTGNGGMGGVEAHANWVDPDYLEAPDYLNRTPNWGVSTISSFAESASPASMSLGQGYGHGYWAEAQYGDVFSAFSAARYAVGTGDFLNYFVGSQSRNQADIDFKIDGTGHVFGAPGSSTEPSYANIADQDTGLGFGATDQVGFCAGGALRFWTNTTKAATNVPLQLLAGTAVPAGGTAGAGLMFSSTANLGVFFGSGAPTLSAAKGSLYLRTDGSSTSTRIYTNTDGGTTWTNLVTAA